MLKRLKGAAVGCAALAITSTAIYAAGSFSTLPIIGGSSYCASTVTGTGSTGGITGQGQGSTGSICAQTVPAGPSIVTGNEVIPADLNNPSNLTASAGGTVPTTALMSLASLNALPITVSSVPTSTLTTLTASATTGGYLLHNASGNITAVTINLPVAPIDGQQFAINADQVVTTLLVTSTVAGVTITKAPTVITPSTTGTYGYRFMYNAAGTNWYRLN